MTCVIVATIKCDGWTVQGKRCTQSISALGTLVAARANARQHGWSYRNKKDLCPECRTVERVK